jgi:hypothetical protein
MGPGQPAGAAHQEALERPFGRIFAVYLCQFGAPRRLGDVASRRAGGCRRIWVALAVIP